MTLQNKKCIPCSGNEPKLSQEEIKTFMPQVPGWQLDSNPDKITREFEFENFTNAINFINKVADLADTEGHHPDIHLYSFKKVRLELWTHKIDGLHENDFILASKINRL